MSRRKKESLFYHTILVVVVVTITTLLKVTFHKSAPLEYLRESAFILLHPLIKTPESVKTPVVIIDIADPSRLFDPSETSRTLLKGLVSKLAAMEPACIAIDVDFSPDGNDPPKGNEEFLYFCYTLESPITTTKTNNRIPVFLGIARSVGHPREAWLGNPNYYSLCASIRRFPGLNVTMPSLLTFTHDGASLPSLGYAMALAYASRNGVKSLQQGNGETLNLGEPDHHCTIRQTLVSYKMLERLQSLPENQISPEDLLNPNTKSGNIARVKNAELISKVRGKAVLIGSSNLDKARVTSRPEPIPGFYLHACQACTLIQTPLSELPVFSGALLAALIVLVMLFVDCTLIHRVMHGWNSSSREIVVSCTNLFLVFILMVCLAYFLSFLWLDAISAAFAIIIETYLLVFTNGIFSRKLK